MSMTSLNIKTTPLSLLDHFWTALKIKKDLDFTQISNSASKVAMCMKGFTLILCFSILIW